LIGDDYKQNRKEIADNALRDTFFKSGFEGSLSLEQRFFSNLVFFIAGTSE